VSVIGFLLIGLLAGLAASFVTRVERGGCITTTLTGVAGALIGGYLLQAFDVDGVGTFLTALFGAVVLLLLLRMLGLARRR
jgi:uncharacterized membrane protein YeaQ/YmgE (transglycosylase-associated protein family)